MYQPISGEQSLCNECGKSIQFTFYNGQWRWLHNVDGKLVNYRHDTKPIVAQVVDK